MPSIANAGNLAVRSVSAASSATAGLPVAVDVGVARSGRTPAARMRFYLSSDRKRDRGDVRLKGGAAVGRSGRKGVIRVSARPVVPVGQAVGEYRLIACVEQRKRGDCRAARTPLRVTAEPVGTRELVESAVAAHKITPGQGLVYRVFAAFGDPRLPAAYAGDDNEGEHIVRPDELILVISNNSLTQASSSKVPLRVLASNIGCSRYTGEVSGTSTYRTAQDSLDESWKATGLVYERILADEIEAPRFLFNLTAGSVTWSLSGHSSGRAVKAGPVTLPVQANGSNGQLDIRAAISSPTWNRRYFAQVYGLPAVQGTATCPGGTYTRWFGPHASILSTSAGPLDSRTIPPDGVLEGTETHTEGPLVTGTWSWRLVPDR